MKLIRKLVLSNAEGIDIAQSSFMIGAVKLVALSMLVALQYACETPLPDNYNRRDLYSSESALAAPKATSTPAPKPQFR